MAGVVTSPERVSRHISSEALEQDLGLWNWVWASEG